MGSEGVLKDQTSQRIGSCGDSQLLVVRDKSNSVDTMMMIMIITYGDDCGSGGLCVVLMVVAIITGLFRVWTSMTFKNFLFFVALNNVWPFISPLCPCSATHSHKLVRQTTLCDPLLLLFPICPVNIKIHEALLYSSSVAEMSITF